VARAYRGGKEALKAGAGWKRFIPFTRARSDYKSALKSYRTGQGLQSVTALNPYDRLMGTSAAQRVRDRVMGRPRNLPESRPDADLLEVKGLLGAGGGGQQSPLVDPGGDAIGEEKPQVMPTQGSDNDDDVGQFDGKADSLLKDDDDLQSQAESEFDEEMYGRFDQELAAGDQDGSGMGGPGGFPAFD